MNEEAIARICHEAFRALQYELNEPCPADPWDALSPEVKESTIYCVRQVMKGADPQQLHEYWRSYKSQQGWTYGPHRNEVERTHPNMVPHAELRKGEQFKDALMVAITQVLKEGESGD